MEDLTATPDAPEPRSDAASPFGTGGGLRRSPDSGSGIVGHGGHKSHSPFESLPTSPDAANDAAAGEHAGVLENAYDAVKVKGKMQLLPPAPPVLPLSQRKIHTGGKNGVLLWADINAATPLGRAGAL